MATIQDVSPTRSNMSFGPSFQFTSGRMLSVDSSDDGRLVFTGSFSSGLWVSEDGGESWAQVERPQPDPGQFGTPSALGGYCVPSVALGPKSARWSVGRSPRLLGDITGDRRADIVGFGDTGVWTALSRPDGTFQPPRVVLADFGAQAGGWRVDRHPRFLADVTGDGRADIVGFGDAGVYVALSNGDGTFQPPRLAVPDFGYDQGWRVEKHPRFVVDITGDGRADIVGFGDAGVYVARNNGNGTFAFQPVPVINDFGFQAGGWRVDKHPRLLADITGDGRADIVGFGDAGVYVSRANQQPFEAPRFVLSNFGFEATVLAMVQSDRESADAGVWRSSNRGATWTLVHAFPRDPSAARLPAAGQLVWAPGTANLVFAAGGSSLAVSTDGGANFVDVMRTPQGGFQPVNHVAVAATPAGALRPPAVYALANGRILVSFDGGMTWTQDGGPVPGTIGGAVGLANSQNERVMVVSPRSPLEVFATGNANLNPPELWRGDYSQFPQTSASQWTPLPLPNMGSQDSGNVFVAATLPGHGNALFYGPQRSKAFVAPLDPASPADWHELDEGHHVHVDLHGIFLSPDFAATFQDGAYRATAGTVWLASDGGISRSTDGGKTFHAAGSISTLSTVNMAGVALPGAGPVISLNTGDNDGFASRDGGLTWRTQNYGGGDNDCSFADPLRPASMLVFTPRWDANGNSVGGGQGQTLALYEAGSGALPDISGSTDRHMVPGPPLRQGSTIWNASSGYVIRGFRPIVPNLPGDDPAQPGDYVFIRFFGNFSSPATGTLPNNLAVLLRTRHIRDIDERSDWDTPGSWRVEKHPRLLADLTADGRADIVGFGDAGVWTALSTSGGSFADPHFVLADLGYQAGGWRVEKHPRLLADLTGDGRADIVGFGDAGVYVALSNGDGSFAFTPIPVINDFGYEAGGWRVEKHPRFAADVTGDGRADIVGFGDSGVLVGVNAGAGTFRPRALFVIPNFGFGDSGPVEQQGPFLPDPNVSIVQASGGHSGTVFFVSDGDDRSARLWKWTDGMAAWQQLVPGGGATQARRFFVNPYNPSMVYLLDTDRVRRSDDGGVTWQVDSSLEQQLTAGGRIPAARIEDADGQGDHYGVVLTDMQFDPFNAGRRFAVGLGGAFLTTDGVNWQRLLDTGALRGRPANCYFDWISQPADPALYVSFAGRSIVKISGFARNDGPLSDLSTGQRRPTVRTADGHTGTTQPLPDERVLVVLDGGRSLVVDADRLRPQDDGTYLI